MHERARLQRFDALGEERLWQFKSQMLAFISLKDCLINQSVSHTCSMHEVYECNYILTFQRNGQTELTVHVKWSISCLSGITSFTFSNQAFLQARTMYKLLELKARKAWNGSEAISSHRAGTKLSWTLISGTRPNIIFSDFV